MKPTNRFYGSSPSGSEEIVMINCTHCRKSSYSAEWMKNRGNCPLCHKPYAGKLSED